MPAPWSRRGDVDRVGPSIDQHDRIGAARHGAGDRARVVPRAVFCLRDIVNIVEGQLGLEVRCVAEQVHVQEIICAARREGVRQRDRRHCRDAGPTSDASPSPKMKSMLVALDNSTPVCTPAIVALSPLMTVSPSRTPGCRSGRADQVDTDGARSPKYWSGRNRWP